jgi:CheY-like chemotaxis protein
MARRKILVIDDDKDIHAMIRAVLQRTRDSMMSAMDPIQGLTFARQPGIDAIILDIQMPGGGGYSTYERLTSISQTMAIPILIYTAMPEAEVRAKIAESPSTAILFKPASPDEIAAALDRIIVPA